MPLDLAPLLRERLAAAHLFETRVAVRVHGAADLVVHVRVDHVVPRVVENDRDALEQVAVAHARVELLAAERRAVRRHVLLRFLVDHDRDEPREIVEREDGLPATAVISITITIGTVSTGTAGAAGAGGTVGAAACAGGRRSRARVDLAVGYDAGGKERRSDEELLRRDAVAQDRTIRRKVAVQPCSAVDELLALVITAAEPEHVRRVRRAPEMAVEQACCALLLGVGPEGQRTRELADLAKVLDGGALASRVVVVVAASP